MILICDVVVVITQTHTSLLDAAFFVVQVRSDQKIQILLIPTLEMG